MAHPAEFIGYAVFDTLADFMIWHGDCADPALGTVNQVLGLNEHTATRNYTWPIPHPNADYQLTEDGWPIGESQTNEKRVYCSIDSDCPLALQPKTLYTYDQINEMGFIPSYYQTKARSMWSKMVSWFTG